MSEEAPREGRRGAWVRRYRKGVIGGVALVLAAGAGCWAGGVGPFAEKDRYCWGAWEQDSGPGFLGKQAFSGGGTRTATSAAPSAGSPRGTCTVTVRTSSTASGETIRYEDVVSVGYGPVPGPAAERAAWLGEFLQGSAERLPGDLPGLADADRGMLVLPKECDVEGRPAAVTLRTRSTGVSASGTSHSIVATLGTGDIAKMLLAAAGRGMREAGCAPAGALRLKTPFPTPEQDGHKARTAESSPFPQGVCEITGLRAGEGEAYVWNQTGGDRRLQICSVTAAPRGGEPRAAGQFVAVSGLPRLQALFDGMGGEAAPGPGRRGKGTIGARSALVRAGCGEGGIVFFQQLDAAMARAASPGPEQVFANGVRAAAARAGCAPVAPAG
ncbi:hypothetical protein M1P56_17745 [Streptomyces sp. HU2014]|uniref:hypothetical protein n=1 Tax=Streptomyces sp. HU2014 TaxID=2939414 RepID=UPI00200C5CF7|nr:hypothetical protein [Streptomyces sp. HU2014]UQI49637.1 hypothetical protein M1P56_17745 [Streptomyces sp. HU2014]